MRASFVFFSINSCDFDFVEWYHFLRLEKSLFELKCLGNSQLHMLFFLIYYKEVLLLGEMLK